MDNRRALLWAVLLVGCNPIERSTSDMARAGDLGARADLTLGSACTDQSPCPMGQRCYGAKCITDNGTCQVDDDCQNDTYCDCESASAPDAGAYSDGGSSCLPGICVPYGVGPRGLFDPTCRGQAFTPAEFAPPVVRCRWSSPISQPAGTLPLVVDLDKDGHPEIVFNYKIGGLGGALAIRGSDCSEVWTAANIGGAAAAGDLDGDGFPEIITDVSNVFVAVLDHTGMLAGQLSGMGQFLSNYGGTPAIANIDGQGPAEFLGGPNIFRYENGQIDVLVNKDFPFQLVRTGGLSLFADLDADGQAELVTGLTVLDGLTGTDKTPAALAAVKPLNSGLSLPAVADFNGDGTPDIVNVQTNLYPTDGDLYACEVSVFDVANNQFILGPFKAGKGIFANACSAPTVADFDGDHVPDIGFSFEGGDRAYSGDYQRYVAYSTRCAQQPLPPDCREDGVLWQREESSIHGGSSSFDFNGDGYAEVASSAGCWLRVLDGRNGNTLFARRGGAPTGYPVIADANADGHADLIVAVRDLGSACEQDPEGQIASAGPPLAAGLYVFSDPTNRWVSARKVWNQHTYHITNVNDDGTIPTTESPSWQALNNYRSAGQPSAVNGPAPIDLTAGVPLAVDNGGRDCKVVQRLWANLCNRGSQPAQAGIAGTFYLSDPRQAGATAICTTRTTKTLGAGECEQVACDWQMPSQNAVDIWFRAGDDGSMLSVGLECKENNNLLFLPQLACGGLG